jgi:serine/tyrosine/threonine adenylyltransferase
LCERRGPAGEAANEDDAAIFADLFAAMERTGADMTNTFRLLSRVSSAAPLACLDALLDQCCTVREQARARRPRYARRQLEALAQLQRQDPATFALLMSQHAGGDHDDDDSSGAANAAAAAGAAMIAREMQAWVDYEQLLQTDAATKRAADRAVWAPWLERYARRVQEELAEGGPDAAAARAAAMDRANPKFILRNHLAQRAIADAEAGNYDEARNACME